MKEVSLKVWEYAHALNNIGKLARDKHFALIAKMAKEKK